MARLYNPTSTHDDIRGGVADILEVSLGESVVCEAARLMGYRMPPAFVHLGLAYGVAWDLELDVHSQAVCAAIELFVPRVLVVNLMKKEILDGLLRLTVQAASAARGGLFRVAINLCTGPPTKTPFQSRAATSSSESTPLIPPA